MFTTYTNSQRKAFSGLAAVAVLAVMGLTLDQGHTSALRSGTVEVGELTPIGLEKLAQVTLPEIFITAERPAAQGPHFAKDAKAHGATAVAAVAGDVR